MACSMIRGPVRRVGPSFTRYFSTNLALTSEHAQFLSLVSGHGGGEVKLQFIGPETSSQTKVAEITLNNPEKRNAVTGKMMKDIAEIVDHLTLSEDMKSSDCVAVILRSTGDDIFSSGADFGLASAVINSPDNGLLMSQFMTNALNRLRSSGYISVCAVTGSALGGGAELITTTDFRIMSSAKNHFIQFIHAKLGASPGWGGARRLTEIVGRQSALRLVASAERVAADQALRIGLVDHVIPQALSDQDWRAASLAFLQPYTSMPYPKSVRAVKQAIGGVEGAEIGSAILHEQQMFYERWFSADNQEAIAKATKKK